MEFENKTALLTGAATGIGRSLAVALAREGADLALLDIDSERGQETAELVRAYYKIQDPKQRRKFLELLRSMADAS